MSQMCPVSSSQTVALQDFVHDATAKTFRTSNGSVAALEAALDQDTRPAIRKMSEAAAWFLHNTPTTARKSCIHPAAIDLAGSTHDLTVPDRPDGLRRAEGALLRLLRA